MLDPHDRRKLIGKHLAIVVPVAVVLAILVTGSCYYAIFGFDDRFWQSIALAAIVPVIVTPPISYSVARIRVKLVEANMALRETRASLQRANNELEYKASHDAMTAMYNRETLLLELNRLCTEKTPCTLLIADIDRFKRINDLYGHAEGDVALTIVSDVIKRSVSSHAAIVGRIGGEEFAVALPHLAMEEAAVLADIVRLAVESADFVPREKTPCPLTISIGLTQSQAGDTPSSVFRRADEALLQAKRDGRNRVVCSSKDMEGAQLTSKAA